MNILIIDDQKEMLNLLKIYLQDCHKLYCSDNGYDALNIYRDNPDINLVITDLIMPHMDGFEVIKKLRCMCGNLCRKINIIAMSAGEGSSHGFTSQEYVCLAKRHGADYSLLKPFCKNAILDIINALETRIRSDKEANLRYTKIDFALAKLNRGQLKQMSLFLDVLSTLDMQILIKASFAILDNTKDIVLVNHDNKIGRIENNKILFD